MKTIGLIGGMSWESTSLYYRLINEYIKNKLGKNKPLEFEEVEIKSDIENNNEKTAEN